MDHRPQDEPASGRLQCQAGNGPRPFHTTERLLFSQYYRLRLSFLKRRFFSFVEKRTKPCLPCTRHHETIPPSSTVSSKLRHSPTRDRCSSDDNGGKSGNLSNPKRGQLRRDLQLPPNSQCGGVATACPCPRPSKWRSSLRDASACRLISTLLYTASLSVVWSVTNVPFIMNVGAAISDPSYHLTSPTPSPARNVLDTDFHAMVPLASSDSFSGTIPSSNDRATFSTVTPSTFPVLQTVDYAVGSDFQNSPRNIDHFPITSFQQKPTTPATQHPVQQAQPPPSVSIGSYVLDNVAGSSVGTRLVGATPLSGPKVGHPVEGSPVLNVKPDKDGWFSIEDLKLSRMQFDVTLKQGEHLALPFSVTANEKVKVFLRATANFEKSASTLERTADLIFMHEIEEKQSQISRDREHQQNYSVVDCREADGPCHPAGTFGRDSESPDQAHHGFDQDSQREVPYRANRRLGTVGSFVHGIDAAYPHNPTNAGGVPAFTPSDDRRGGTRPRRRPELAARARGVQRAISGSGDARVSSVGSEGSVKYSGSSPIDVLGRNTTGIPIPSSGRVPGIINWQSRMQAPPIPNSSTGQPFNIWGTGTTSPVSHTVPNNPFFPLSYDSLPVEPWEGWSESLKLLAAETRKVDWATSQRMLQAVRLQVGAAITSDLAMNLRSDDSDIDPAASNRISGRRGEARSLGLPTREVNYGRTGGQSSSTLGGSLRVQGVSALPLSAFEVHAIESKDDWQPRSSQEGPSHQDVSLDASSPMQKLHRLVGDASELQDAASRPASDDTLNNEKRNSVPLLPGKRAGDANFLSEPRGVATNNSPSSQPDTSRVNSATANQPKRKTTKARNSVPDSGQSSPRGQMVVVNVEALGSPIDKDTGRPLFYNDRILVGWRCSDHELLALKALEMEEEEEEDDVPQGSSLSAPASMDDPNASITDEKPQVGIPCAQSGFDPLTLGASQSEIRLCGYVPPDLGIDIRSLRDSRQTTSSASASSNPAVPLDLSQVSALWPNTRRPRNNNENSAHFGNFNRHGNMSPADSPSAVFASSDNSKRRTSTPGQPGLSDGMVGAPPRRLQVLDRMLKSYASPEVESVKTLFRRLPQKRSLRKKVPHGETWKRPESQVDNQETLSASDAQKNNSNSGLGISSKDMAEERQSLGLSSGNHATSKGATRPSKGNLDRSGGTVYSEHTRSPGTGDNLEGGRAGKNIRDSVTEDSKTEEFVKKRLLDDDELCGMDLIKLSLKHYRARVEGTRYDGYPENNSENVEALKAFMKEFASHDYVGDILFLAPDAPIHAHATSPELNGEASPTDGEECTSASCTSKHPTEIGNKEEQARSAFRVNPPQPPALAPDDRDSVQRSNSNVNKTVKISEYPNGSADKQQSIFLKRTLNSDNSKNLDFWAVNGFGPYPTSAPGDKRAEKVSQDEDGVAEEPFRVGKPSVPEQTIHAVSSNRSLQETLQVSESGKEESGRTVFPNDPLFSLQWSLGSPPQDVQMSAEFCFLRAREELQGRSADADERGAGGSFQQTPNKSQLAKVRQLCEAAGHKDKYATGGKLRATTLAAEVEDGQGDTDQHKKDGITPDSASTLQAEANEKQVQDLEGDMEERQTTPSLQESAELHVLQGSHAGRGGGTHIGENAADANSIDMVKAWRLSLSPQDEDNKKKQEVLVAVIDTGVNYIHSDLANSIWVNEQELNGIPGFDDDQNGYIDDVYGWNFLHGNNNPMDDNGHGSHVAGIIGAQRNNNQGVSGISSHARIIALKILNKKGEGDVSHAIPAIRYALDNGAKVITNSWGGISGPGTQILGVLLKEAVADASGSVFVIAAGNDGMDISKDPYYPASFLRDWTITVAAHARDGALPKWSNYGHNTVHLTAPGENITSTWMGSGYRLSSGTSMAAPMVSGVAAEILAYNPMLQPQQVVDVLVQSAITDKRHANVSLTGARLNAYRAIILSQLQFVSLSPAELHVGGTVDPVGEVEMIFRSLMLPPGVYEGTIELVYSRRLASTRGLGMLSGVLKRRIVQLVQVTLPVKLTIIQ